MVILLKNMENKIDLIHTENLTYLENDDLDNAKERFIQYGKSNFNQNKDNTVSKGFSEKQQAVLQLINAYRLTGHLFAQLDPLKRENTNIQSLDLDLSNYNLSEQDLNTEFDTGLLFGAGTMSLKKIVDKLKKTYCGSAGFDYMHIVNTQERHFLQERIETQYDSFELPEQQKIWALRQLTAAETFENFLHNKYSGQKRFSLEGGESTIPVINNIINYCSEQYNTKRLALGMAHRGRLNVLVNVLGKQASELFKEFSGDFALLKQQTGDVKYHLGYSSNVKTNNSSMRVSLAFNPSHLEIVNPVVEGYTRYYQEKLQDTKGKQVIPVLIHGDAAFTGQGVVMETMNMSQSKGFYTHGTLHIVINNQIGFTTSNQTDARSTHHCTDIAKMINAPVLHVNADDLQAVLFVTKLAVDYRMKFQKDVVIDLVCYRRHGHNEADEPSVTQPDMYKRIRALKTTREIYANYLVDQGICTAKDTIGFIKEYQNKMRTGEGVVELEGSVTTINDNNIWKKYFDTQWTQTYDSTLSAKKILSLNKKLQKLPDDFKAHPIVVKTMQQRDKMAKGNTPIDWGCAEILAYASLAADGTSIRLCGQDSGRGTFFHRHAVLHNQNAIESYIPLQNLHSKQGKVNIIDSVLSEEAVLAFEYGYSSATDDALVIWEAQFGDFVNGAQVVIDQFISSAEVKWGRLSNLVMMLPHGLEGAGPEHSSGRIERFLQLCSHYNMQICVPTTASQIFHLIRRQIIRNFRRPLIIFTPKSLLRNPLANSPLSELTSGEFKIIIDEQDKEIVASKVKRVVLCSGKISYDLITRRQEEKIKNIAILRIEQLYPFSRDVLLDHLFKFKNAKELVWCQEEPINQGAWYTTRHQFIKCAQKQKMSLNVVARDLSAASAEGSMQLHKINQNMLIEQALDLRTINEE